MCNVPAPLRRRRYGHASVFEVTLLRCARERVRVVSLSRASSSSVKSPVGGVTHSVFFVTSLAGRGRPTSVLLSLVTIQTDTATRTSASIGDPSPSRRINF